MSNKHNSYQYPSHSAQKIGLASKLALLGIFVSMSLILASSALATITPVDQRFTVNRYVNLQRQVRSLITRGSTFAITGIPTGTNTSYVVSLTYILALDYGD
ncbi:hypothetical protein [Pseudobacteriovorax antillogorgiicola]|uniref:Uncharacterized protein n=1 Tax=Pseudobacteriovorax antillogorgiicola TaxID=1513793 RepID=A0A1Y6C7R5_9BACT|nr:hypothetical protein [Pseudobacteriovorax antillogorgiicola]TCS50765.1 hypothetical protein EDD56_112148 [Pseudobacteriovorax antillogorgiicola]SMF41237.1 hypothetical protein SAMN06296036_112147 [Pseudobacteriovorax antillogorgiicola]